jgi:hypothetical protein
MRAVSAARQLSLQLSGEQFKFRDAPASADFDRYETFVRYDIEGSRTDMGLDLGYTLLEQAQEDTGGLLARLSATRRLSSAAQVSVSLGTEFSDAGNLFRSDLERPEAGGQAGGQAGAVLGAGDPFENRFAELGWHFRLNRTGMGLDARRGEERYQTLTALDRAHTSFGVYLERRLTPALTARADARLVRQSFESGFEDEELQAGAMLSWALGRTLALNLRYDRLDRDSPVALAQFTENRLALFAVWSPLARR